MIFMKSLSFQIRSLKIKGKNQINSIGGYSERIFENEKSRPQAESAYICRKVGDLSEK